MVPSNPPFLQETCEEHISSYRRAVCVRACNTGLSGRPLTLVVTVTLDFKLVPVAKQPGLLSHQKLPDINIVPWGERNEEF